MGLLYGANALKSLQDYKTQQDFNNDVIVTLQNIANAVDVVTKTAGNNGADLITKQNAIDAIKQDCASLHTAFNNLSASFATLGSDNGQFKSDVSSTIDTFNKTVASFSGSLTSLTAANQQNTNDINTLKQTTNNDLLQKVMTGLTTLSDTVTGIISQNYQPALDAFKADLTNKYNALATSTTQQITQNNGDLNNKISTNATAIQNNAQQIAENAQAANGGIANNTAAIKAEATRAQAAEADLNTHLSAVDNSNQAEITRAKQAETDLGNRISATGQTASDQADQARQEAENYSDNNLTKGKAYADGIVSDAKQSVTAAYTAADQAVTTNCNAYADKLHAQLLDVSNSALDTANTADNIATDARAKANDAEGQVAALKPQVDAASTKAGQALSIAQGAPQFAVNVTQGRAYSDAFVTITSSGTTANIQPANGAMLVGNYNGGTSQLGAYSLSSGYVYTFKVISSLGIGEYIMDNRNNGVVYSAVFTPPPAH